MDFFHQAPAPPHPGVLPGLTALYATDGAFAALDGHGRVVTWGCAVRGGDSSQVPWDPWDGDGMVMGDSRKWIVIWCSYGILIEFLWDSMRFLWDSYGYRMYNSILTNGNKLDDL